MNKNKICAVHQPDFLPWLGFFDKLNSADVFCFIDKAQYSKITKRNSIKINDTSVYMTIPVGTKQIAVNKILFPEDKKWINKHLSSFRQGYLKTKYYNSIIDDITDIYNRDYTLLQDFNLALIKYFMNRLNIDTEIVIESELNKDFGLRNDRIVNICKYLNANIYLSGLGGKAYNDEQLFNDNGIELQYQDFQFPVYNQIGKSYINNLSIIDTVCNIGFEETERLIKGE